MILCPTYYLLPILQAEHAPGSPEHTQQQTIAKAGPACSDIIYIGDSEDDAVNPAYDPPTSEQHGKQGVIKPQKRLPVANRVYDVVASSKLPSTLTAAAISFLLIALISPNQEPAEASLHRPWLFSLRRD